MPLVELQASKEWSKAADATVRFTTAPTYQRSSWDWVAIYKVLKSDSFGQHFSTYLTVFLFLSRLDSDITKIIRRTCGPKENKLLRCVPSSVSHINLKLGLNLEFMTCYLRSGDVPRGWFTKRWLWIHPGLLQQYHEQYCWIVFPFTGKTIRKN